MNKRAGFVVVAAFWILFCFPHSETVSAQSAVFSQEQAKTSSATEVSSPEIAPSLAADDPPESDEALTEGPLSEAERIAELSRYIEMDEARLLQFRDKLDDPEGEMQTSEATFAALDKQLNDLQQQLTQASADDRPRLQEELSEVQQRWAAAKDRFQLALEERKGLQTQIAALEKKIANDKAELARLKGEEPTEATAEPNTAAAAIEAGKPVEGSANDETGTAVDSATTDVEPPGEPAEAETVERPASEMVRKARVQVEKTERGLAEARAEVEQIGARLDELDDLIEQEQQLLETRRKIAENAWRRVADLNQQLRRKVAEGSEESLPELTAEMEQAEQAFRQSQAEVTESREAIQVARTRQDALEMQRRQAEQLVRDLEGAARVTWIKTWGIVTLDWIQRHALRLLLIVIGFVAVEFLIKLTGRRIIDLFTKSGRGVRRERENRAKTLASVFTNTATTAAVLGAGLLIVAEINPNWIGPLAASLAVVGIAVGLGAQNLVRDYFFGFVLLLENQYGIDDVVKLGDVAGLVERVTLRMTVLRDLDGVVHFVPHGQITTVSNLTHGWSRALFDIGVAYKEDVDRVMEVLLELGGELRDDPQFGPLILEDPEMLGVDRFDDSAVVIKFFIKTRPLQQWAVRRELNRRIKRRFDELGIEIPFPHRTVYHRQVDEQELDAEFATDRFTQGRSASE